MRHDLQERLLTGLRSLCGAATVAETTFLLHVARQQ